MEALTCIKKNCIIIISLAHNPSLISFDGGFFISKNFGTHLPKTPVSLSKNFGGVILFQKLWWDSSKNSGADLGFLRSDMCDI